MTMHAAMHCMRHGVVMIGCTDVMMVVLHEEMHRTMHEVVMMMCALTVGAVGSGVQECDHR